MAKKTLNDVEINVGFNEATTRENLTSGEKINVSFGKIKKWFTDLGTHLADSVAHITATERSNWNSKAAGTHNHGAANIVHTNDYNSAGFVEELYKPMINTSRACKTAFTPVDAILIEDSVDGGVTWTERTSVTDIQKRNIFSMNRGYDLTIGTENPTTETQTRITISPIDRYARVDQFYCWFITCGHTCVMDIERSTIGNKTTFSKIRSDVRLSGWGGANVVNFELGTYGGADSQTYNKYSYRFTIKITALSTDATYLTYKPTIADIRLYGDSCWTRTNNMMYNDNIYSWDYLQNVTFPAKVTATSFIGDLSGNATSATTATTAVSANSATTATTATTANKLTTARTISLTGDITGSGTFDGSSNVSITTNCPTIPTDYVKDLSVTDNEMTIVKGDGSSEVVELGGSSESYYFTTTLYSEDWLDDENGGYSCVKEVSGILATDSNNTFVDVVLSTERAAAILQLETYGYLCSGNVTILTNDSVKFWCYEHKPATAITIEMKVFR